MRDFLLTCLALGALFGVWMRYCPCRNQASPADESAACCDHETAPGKAVCSLKSSSPVSIVCDHEGAVAAGQSTTLVFLVSAPAGAWEWNVILPEGVTVVDGDTHAEGVKNETETLSFELEVVAAEGASGYLVGNATVAVNGARFAASNTLAVGAQPVESEAPAAAEVINGKTYQVTEVGAK